MAGEGLANLTSYANSAYLDGTPVSAAGLHDFCNGYLDVFNRGFHYAFIAAIVMMLVSLVIYLSNKQRFPTRRRSRGRRCQGFGRGDHHVGAGRSASASTHCSPCSAL